MKILSVRQFRTADDLTLSARCKIRPVGLDDLWFKIPIQLENLEFADASPFAAALLLPSMKLGEDLIVQGSISAKLHAGMTELIRIVSGWDVGLKPIRVIADEIVPDVVAPSVTSTFFSGGVDSFYTYLKHKQDPNPVSHLMLINGYDISSHNQPLWAATVRNVREIARQEHVRLIEMESNARALIDPILSWGFSHGGCLAAAALCLRRGLGQMYMPSARDGEHQAPRGTHPAIDHLWSTEGLSFVHDGWEATRFNKVDWQVARSPVALKYLRVCFMNRKSSYNCGQCEKCLRTMVSLYAAGVLSQTETFPAAIDPKRLAAISIEGYHDAVFHRENLAALEERGLSPELQQALRVALSRTEAASNRPPLARRAAGRIVYLDHCYTRGTVRKLVNRVNGRGL